MEKSFKYQNAAVYYDVLGEGEPVVLLHGFGEDRTIWKNQAAFLKSHCQLIVPDLPGTGKSGLLQHADSIDDYAACIYHLLLREKIQEATILGHSMGGYITLALAERYPQVISKFGLINSTAFADSAEKKEVRQKGIEMIKQYGSYSFLKNTIPNLFSDNFKKHYRETIHELIEAGNSFAPEALVQYYTAMMNRPDRTNSLKNARVPVLFIIGTEDVAAPLTDLQQQVRIPPKPHIHILEKVGHMSMLEATDEVNKIMLEFIHR